MKRSGMKRTSHRRNDNPRLRTEWATDHWLCGVCGFFPTKGNEGRMHCHHLVGGPGRIDHPANLLMLCWRCHKQFHDGGMVDANGKRLPELQMGHLLQAKFESDKANYDEELIAKFSGRNGGGLPVIWERKPIPAEFRVERNGR